MRIDTDEEYKAALERLGEIGADPPEGAEWDEFFETNAAMVDYERRSDSSKPTMARRGHIHSAAVAIAAGTFALSADCTGVRMRGWAPCLRKQSKRPVDD